MDTLADLTPEYYEQIPVGMRTARSSRGSAAFAMRQSSKMPESSRLYSHGDPIRMIDWRAFARSDQLIVREDRLPAAVRVQIVIDLRSSMNWPEALPGVNPLPPKKQTMAVNIAFNIAYRHLREQDLVAILVRTDEVPDLQPGSGMVMVRDVGEMRAAYQAMLSPEALIWYQQSAIVGRGSEFCDVCYCLSDGLTDGSDERWMEDLQRRCPSGRRAYLQILSSRELSVNWLESSDIYYEMGAVSEYRGATLLEEHAYQTRLQEWLRNLEGKCREYGIYYALLNDETSIRTYYQVSEQFLAGGRHTP